MVIPILKWLRFWHVIWVIILTIIWVAILIRDLNHVADLKFMILIQNFFCFNFLINQSIIWPYKSINVHFILKRLAIFVWFNWIRIRRPFAFNRFNLTISRYFNPICLIRLSFFFLMIFKSNYIHTITIHCI